MKLFYRELGSGIPLIILHGLYGSSDNWISVARSLSDRFRVILPDQRNHGQSPHDSTHSYNAMSDDLYELTRDMGLSRFYLVGHSMGGKTAMWFASKWPDMLQGLMIIDISPFTVSVVDNPTAMFHKMVLSVLIDLPLNTLASREEADEILSVKIKSPRIRSFLLKNLTRGSNREFAWKLNPIILAQNLENIMEGFKRLNDGSQTIKGFPVTFVRAGNSEYIPQSDFADIELLFPAAEIITVNDSSHWIHAEKPGAITDLISNMID